MFTIVISQYKVCYSVCCLVKQPCLLLLTYDEYILKKTPLALHGYTTRAIFEQVSLIVLVLPSFDLYWWLYIAPDNTAVTMAQNIFQFLHIPL